MARHKREPKRKIINPKFFVFFEGESEVAYINHLRLIYRKPVEIIPKVTKNQVNTRLIKEIMNTFQVYDKDKVFLVYDIDVDGFLDKLITIQKEISSTLITSNPCLELWYLLHFTNQTSEISADKCVQKLKSYFKSYQKGSIDLKM